MSTDVTVHDEGGELSVGAQPTIEELREGLLLGIQTLVRQASGIKDSNEFELIYGKSYRHLRMVLDHIITLAANHVEDRR